MMTNIKWLRTLSADELVAFLTGSCRICIHYGKCHSDDEYDCSKGKVAWLNQEHKEELKPCANCGGEAKFVADVINPEMVYVQCCECHIRTPVGTKYYTIKTWNRRVDNENA